MSAVPSSKTSRILACALCATRKVKCDRNFPCGNCVKANIECIPGVPAPPRKRRRPNQALQERLAKCEALLSQLGADPEAGLPSESPKEAKEQEDPLKSIGKSLGCLVLDDAGSAKFTDSFLWASVYEELREMRKIVDDDAQEDDISSVSRGSSLDENTSLALSDTPIDAVEDPHPQPAHAVYLWQVFLDRVNPLTKIIHVPTIQPILFEAMTNPGNVPKNHEALLFSIYLMAVVSMSKDECEARLGCPKKVAIDRFSRATRLALTHVGILKSCDIVVLQTLVLYTMSLCSRYDHQSAWMLNGIIVRLAQKLGLHKDGESLGLRPFDAELRRRIWLQIITVDSNSALILGLGRSFIPHLEDVKAPTNVNDADLFPDMTTIQPKEGPTDMIYCLCNVEIRKLFLTAPRFEAIVMRTRTAPGEDMNSDTLEKALKARYEFEKSIEDLLGKYGDPSAGPVHDFSFQVCGFLASKLKQLLTLELPRSETEDSLIKDHLFTISVFMMERCVGWYRACYPSGNFLWYATAHFNINMLTYMAGQLTQHRSGQLVECAWAALEALYGYHSDLFDLSLKVHANLARFVLRAWKIRQKTLLDLTGCVTPTPAYIAKLESLVQSPHMKLNSSQDTTSDHGLFNSGVAEGANASFGVPWDPIFGFLEPSGFGYNPFPSVWGQIPMNYDGMASNGGTDAA